MHTSSRLGEGSGGRGFPSRGVVAVDRKTISGGTFSPNVRLSFAIRFRRISASVGAEGVTGDGISGRGRAVNGDDGGVDTRTSSASTETVLKRRTSGCGASFERRGLALKDFGIGSTSALDWGDGSAMEDAEELREL